ncbi:cannabinoid receptor type 1B-like [Physella acuta]|uniref:cannabinoid receptor type 1B-like n=1 Tax=Physella acuta TaxID=109671 RepID=UPI0027DD43B0|nr:cannabinoid receptor type 1B-like [Physella acuta]
MESGPVILLVAAVLIATCVFILSPITCLAILKTPSLRHNHSNLFLLNLGLVDMLLMVLVIAFNVFALLDVRDNQTACVISIVAFGTMVMASLLSSFAIAVDRFLFIHKAITYNIIVTQGRVLKTVAVIWIVSLVNGLIPLLGDLTKTDACIHPATKALCLQGILIVSLFLTTGVISVCLYGKLFFIIRQHNHVLETHARAHCRTHDCKKQACRIKSRLGECHFQQVSLPSSLSYTRSETFDTEDSRTSLMAKCETRPAPLTTLNGIDQSVKFSLSLDSPDQTKVTKDEREDCTSAAKATLWSWIKVQSCGLYRRRLKRDNASISRESTFVSFHVPSPEDRANVDQDDNIDRANVDHHDNIDRSTLDQDDNIDRTTLDQG